MGCVSGLSRFLLCIFNFIFFVSIRPTAIIKCLLIKARGQRAAEEVAWSVCLSAVSQSVGRLLIGHSNYNRSVGLSAEEERDPLVMCEIRCAGWRVMSILTMHQQVNMGIGEYTRTAPVWNIKFFNWAHRHPPATSWYRSFGFIITASTDDMYNDWNS